MRFAIAALLLCLGLSPARAAVPPDAAANPTGPATTPRIAVATMQPGDVFWERFGHDSIVVDDPRWPEPVSYNFGFFDLGEPGFVPRFIRGEMQYMLVALPLSQDLRLYREEGRGVSLQWLDLDPAQARALADALAINARPENARYRYDYFRDNCATRVRDAVDRALGGALQRRFDATSLGNTYRSESVRLASPAPWMRYGFDLGLGPAADRPLTRWENAFIPMRLADLLREARRADGRPLVSAEESLLPHRIAPEPADPATPWWPWLFAGLGGAALVAWAASRAPRWAGALGIVFWTACGLLGSVMAALWLATDHRYAWANHNLWLLSPLSLPLLPTAWAWLRGKRPGRGARALAWVSVALACAGMLQLWLGLPSPQPNAGWVALLLPLHLAWAWALQRDPAVVAPRRTRHHPRHD